MTFVLTMVGAALAVALELLEAMAIVLAVAAVRRPRDAILGALGAVVVLAVAAVVIGPLALESVPEDALEVVIGTALLFFGLEWLRKGVLRLAGRRSPSSALQEYLDEREAMEALPSPPEGRADWPARIVAALSKGEDAATPALLGAGLAVVAVTATGFWLRRPLGRLPESHLKYGVGVVLTSFGVVFVAEGAGAAWPGGDAALLYVVAALAAISLFLVRDLTRIRTA